MTSHEVLIVGAGHAGAQCAIALRQAGFTGSVAMVTEEGDYPKNARRCRRNISPRTSRSSAS